MAKQIITGNKAREKIRIGVQKLSDIVSITLGPKGRNVGLDKKWIDPQVLHDGVSIARDIELEDPFENFAAKLVLQASAKTNDKAGDGTTTSAFLTNEIIARGVQALRSRLFHKSVNPMTMKKGIELATREAIALLKKYSKPTKSMKDIEHIATLSSSSPEIGAMVAQAMEKVGKEGVIIAEESSIAGIELEVKEGMQFDKGFISPLLVTDPNKMTAVLVTPHLLITTHSVMNASDIAVFLRKFTEETKRAEIVIIAPMIGGTALATLILNKDRGGIIPLAIQAPAIGLRQRDILEDIATLTGGKVVDRDQTKFDDITIDMLGKADSVMSDEHHTEIVGGFGDSEKIKQRADAIRTAIEGNVSDFEKVQLRERLSRLVSGAAIIKVGGMTEVELKERKERVIDAIEATKSATEEGIVAGGGITLLRIAKDLKHLKNPNHDIQIGINIIREALQQPIVKLLTNAGEDVKKIFIGMLNIQDYGYNIETEQFGNMIDMGIIDPTKVVRNALENASSIAALLLTTEAILCEITEKEKQNEPR